MTWFGSLVTLASPPVVHAERGCSAHLEVISAHATFATKSFQGQPIEKSAKIDVEVHSTSTTAVSSIELAIFLGASMAAIDVTRPEALPTLRPRNLEGGGLAFRSLVEAMVPAGATRTLRLEKAELPLGSELGSVEAKVVDCRVLAEVGPVTIVPPPEPAGPALTGYVIVGALLALGAAILIVRRLR